MDLEDIVLSETSQRKTYLYVSSYPWNLKIKQNSEHNKVETNSQIKRTNQWLIMGRRKAEG